MQITISKPASYIDVSTPAPTVLGETSPISSPTKQVGKRGKKGKRGRKTAPLSTASTEQQTSPAAASPAIDKITGYDGNRGDTLMIDSASFGIRPEQCTFSWATCEPATFGAAEDPSDIRFIYRTDTGYLYYNENGPAPGMGAGGVLAVFDGVPNLGGIYIT